MARLSPSTAGCTMDHAASRVLCPVPGTSPPPALPSLAASRDPSAASWGQARELLAVGCACCVQPHLLAELLSEGSGVGQGFASCILGPGPACQQGLDTVGSSTCLQL